MKRRLLLGAILILALAAAAIYFYGGGRAPAGQAALQTLTPANVSSIRSAFNAGKDDARLLLLLSPT